MLENKPNKSKGPKHTFKYCNYHMDYNHNTDDCIMLKVVIKNLIRKGTLKNYVKDEGNMDKKIRSSD